MKSEKNSPVKDVKNTCWVKCHHLYILYTFITICLLFIILQVSFLIYNRKNIKKFMNLMSLYKEKEKGENIGNLITTFYESFNRFFKYFDNSNTKLKFKTNKYKNTQLEIQYIECYPQKSKFCFDDIKDIFNVTKISDNIQHMKIKKNDVQKFKNNLKIDFYFNSLDNTTKSWINEKINSLILYKLKSLFFTNVQKDVKIYMISEAKVQNYDYHRKSFLGMGREKIKTIKKKKILITQDDDPNTYTGCLLFDLVNIHDSSDVLTNVNIFQYTPLFTSSYFENFNHNLNNKILKGEYPSSYDLQFISNKLLSSQIFSTIQNYDDDDTNPYQIIVSNNFYTDEEKNNIKIIKIESLIHLLYKESNHETSIVDLFYYIFDNYQGVLFKKNICFILDKKTILIIKKFVKKLLF